MSEPDKTLVANAHEVLLNEVKEAIRTHHFNLDCRQQAHGSAYQAIDTIMKVLDMPYVQGDELRRRGESIKK